MQVVKQGLGQQLTFTPSQDLVTFHSSDPQGKPVYHTNVLMAIGTDVAVVCLESVTEEKERQHLSSRLSRHHEARLSAKTSTATELKWLA